MCCSPRGHKELDTTERLNNNNVYRARFIKIIGSIGPFDTIFFNFLFIYFFDTILFLKKIIFGCAGSLLLHMGFLQLRRAGATL